MAERRMFAKAIIGSARFLRMPSTSRLLYYDLGMEADDDGCVEAFAVMRKTGANDDDLRVLVSKGFVRVLNEDLVSLILDWKTNNYIQKDRYHPSIYAKLIDNPPMDTECIQSVYEMDTEVRLGKVSKGQVSKDYCGALPDSTPPVAVLPLVDGTEYPVTEKDAAELSSLYPAVDVAQELRNMRGWLLANPKNRKTKAGIKRFVNGWLSREQNRARPEKQGRTGPSGIPVDNQPPDELMKYF